MLENSAAIKSNNHEQTGVEKGAIIILDHIWRSREVNFYECIILHCLKKTSKAQPNMFDSFLIFCYFGRERFSKPRKGEFGWWAFISWERWNKLIALLKFVSEKRPMKINETQTTESLRLNVSFT